MKKWPPPSKNIEAFFDAMLIPNGRNRAIVCTGKAHAMSIAEIDETIERLEADDKEKLAKLIELRAPCFVIAAAEKGRNLATIKLLRRVKKQKEKN